MSRSSRRSPRPTIDEAAFVSYSDVTQKKLVTFDQLFRVLAGRRYEILTILALHQHMKAGAVADGLGLKKPATSRDLQTLHKCGMVDCAKDGTIHWFRLSRRMRGYVRAGRVQLGYGLPGGDWLWLHREEFSRSQRQVALPTAFIDPGSRRRRRRT